MIMQIPGHLPDFKRWGSSRKSSDLESRWRAIKRGRGTRAGRAAV